MSPEMTDGLALPLLQELGNGSLWDQSRTMWVVISCILSSCLDLRIFESTYRLGKSYLAEKIEEQFSPCKWGVWHHWESHQPWQRPWVARLASLHFCGKSINIKAFSFQKECSGGDHRFEAKERAFNFDFTNAWKQPKTLKVPDLLWSLKIASMRISNVCTSTVK